MPREEFEKLIVEAVDRLPEKIKSKIENVAFLVEDIVRRKKNTEDKIMYGQTLLGLYEGIPKTKRGEGYFYVLPDKITIFQNPIERICGGNPEKIRQLVYEVVWHEVGHHFGFGERAIRHLEKKRFPK